MNKMQSQVADFHLKYNGNSENTPHIPSAETLLLRSRLISEELAEFMVAASSKDMIEMIDALCDILYVTFGTADAIGVDIEPFFDEVQRSNMSKQGKDASGKIQKGPNYSPPDLRAIFSSVYGRGPIDMGDNNAK